MDSELVVITNIHQTAAADSVDLFIHLTRNAVAMESHDQMDFRTFHVCEPGSEQDLTWRLTCLEIPCEVANTILADNMTGSPECRGIHRRIPSKGGKIALTAI
jgi:hypothetical protein